MIKNYLTIAWRNLLKQKMYFLLNISGLAIGLACFLLISLYVLDELSFDKYQAKADRIYRINANIKFGGSEFNAAISSDVMGPMLKKDYPEVETFARLYNNDGSKLIKKGESYINETKVANVDSTFFDVFSFKPISGDLHTALNAPNTAVISESAAKKYFGTIDALGKSLETNEKGKTIYKVTAVIKDMPENTQFHYDVLLSMKNVDYPWNSPVSHNFHTYILLKPGTDYKSFEARAIPQYITTYVMPAIQAVMKMSSLDDFRKSGGILEYHLMPLTQVHLHSQQIYELEPQGSIQYVYIFGAVALFILIIACINFMNLSTARSAGRAREVGIRKVLGSGKKELIAQFLSESTLMAWMALVLAVLIAWAALPLFNSVSTKSMHISSLFSPYILPLLIALPFVVGLLAGSYPAFFLSAFMPIQVLKGKLKLGSSSGSIRSILVVFQFATSIFLIIGTIVIYKQLNYIQTKDLGFNRSQILIIDGTYNLKDAKSFKQDVLGLSGVESGTISAYLPVSNSDRNDNVFFKTPIADVKNGIESQYWRVDYDYIKTLGMNVLYGRGFSTDFGSDSNAYVVNETTAKLLGNGNENVVGKMIYSINDSGAPKPHPVIGVLKNFNYESLHTSVAPLILALRPNMGGSISFKVRIDNIHSLLSSVEAKWNNYLPGMPFQYRFMDDSFDEMYRAEQRVGKITLSFSVLAILVACLGLFGLATFMAEQRTREIGIRKVLGASTQNLVQLMSKDFLKLVLVSFIIAAPLGWYIMNHWLQDFVYRIDISWWIFLVAGIGALAIALFTVSFQAIKAALKNPVISLRAE
jgi:putative ABC transport system permease protein